MSHYFKILPLILILLAFNPVQAMTDDDKIEILIDRVGDSKAVFYRNGDEHTPGKAKFHISFKYKKARRKYFFFGGTTMIPVMDFIDKVASTSSTTGKPYYIKVKGKKKQTMKSWFLEELKIIEKNSSGK
jgi:hypothetical protein